MRLKVMVSAALVVAVAAIAGAAAFAGDRSSQSSSGSMAGMHMQGATTHSAAAVTASDLRALLGRQFGEHAVLAMNATNAGVSGSPTFPTILRSVEGVGSLLEHMEVLALGNLDPRVHFAILSDVADALTEATAEDAAIVAGQIATT